ncbi:LacI family DNA-binding transcriptional regulator [Sorangium sp. So ce1335]|uniref:LacI family DNA-binding transcriptional regulator n=1 Tax=Sorangium sp. So ce1335 TaxID=3133335 RepID=UPI003F607310
MKTSSEAVMTSAGPRPSVRMEEVARHAGVSPATVSRVLNDRGKCSAATRERVLAAIRDLGYVANPAARSLAQGKTGSLGLLLPAVGTDFISSFLQFVAGAATDEGYDLLIALRSEGAQRRMLGRHNTDGVLVFGSAMGEPSLRRLASEGFPSVLLYRSAPEGLSLPSVLIDNEAGVRAAVDHLIEAHGRRRIAFLRGRAGSEDAALREAAYRESLARHGIPVDPGLCRGGLIAEEARASTIALLRERAAFDAVVGWCDGAAIGAMDALRSEGMRVPADVSVVGFDDIGPARHLDPALTTVRAPTELVGRHAVRELVRLIQSGTAEPQVRLPVELIVRRSCGCAR